MMTENLSAGDTLDNLVIPPISRTTLALFAGASGDHNPIHIDTDVAREAGMDDVFGQGMLTMAFLARLLTDNFPLDRIRSYKARFTSIMPVHGQPTCSGVVREITDVDGESRAVLDLTVTLADGSRVLVGEAAVALA